MRNTDKDHFIYNYFEGNLSTSELELFNELKQTDTEFADQVNRWSETYFDERIETVEFTRKELVYKKGNKRLLVGMFLLMTLGLVYLFVSNQRLNEKTESLEKQLIKNSYANEEKYLNVNSIGLKEDEVEKSIAVVNDVPVSLPRSFKTKSGDIKSNQTEPQPEEIEASNVIEVSEETVTIDTLLSIESGEEDSILVKVDTIDLVTDKIEPTPSKKVKKKKHLVKWSEIRKSYKSQKLIPLE